MNIVVYESQVAKWKICTEVIEGREYVTYLGVLEPGETIANGTNKTSESLEKQAGYDTPLTKEVKRQLEEYFAGKLTEFELPTYPRGTEFQKRVWSELCNIPYGETRSYGDVAKKIGNPKAARAIGMANNRNPLAIIVPCHRVIGADGGLVGYGGGLLVKKALLDLETKGI